MLEDKEAEAAAALLPDHLKEGWKCYRDWWMSRYRAGDPLPPGGVFIMNKRAVLLDELFRLHVEAAHGLGVAFEQVTVDLDIDAMGRPVPTVDVRPPPGWMPDLPKRVIMEAGKDREQLANEYVSGYLQQLYKQLQERIAVRVRSLSANRPELQPQEVIRGQPEAGQGAPTG
jgi:hypothetical protein